ncbi:MAG: hypothetical protein WBE76_28015 [Terracidiphilus sp.]
MIFDYSRDQGNRIFASYQPHLVGVALSLEDDLPGLRIEAASAPEGHFTVFVPDAEFFPQPV